MTDRLTLEDADLGEVYDTFRSCSVGDRVTITSYYPAVKDSQQEYFEYTGEVVESSSRSGMPGIVIESDDPDAAQAARVVYPLSEDYSLEVRFIAADGSVQLGGDVTSFTIESDSSEVSA